MKKTKVRRKPMSPIKIKPIKRKEVPLKGVKKR